MAVTTENSTQYANQIASPIVKQAPSEISGRVRIATFQFTQGAAAGDATSIANLVKLQPGVVRIKRIDLVNSALGAARTCDFGYAAHTDINGNAVAASQAAFIANLDVSAAATIQSVIPPDNGQVISKDGFVVTAQINDGTIPAAATLDGYIEYSVD